MDEVQTMVWSPIVELCRPSKKYKAMSKMHRDTFHLMILSVHSTSNLRLRRSHLIPASCSIVFPSP